MNGIMVIDKPCGKTSHDMVNFVRRLTGIRRVGHTGTLDPMATGVLPVCIGSAAKTADMLTASDKRYRAQMRLGIITDTEDISGNVLETRSVKVNREEIYTAVKGFVGGIEQIPPMYSAIKQNGKKLYELAREGIVVERPKRKITIYSADVIGIDEDNSIITLDVHCSKGTYIRTLCSDIGERLGTGACMTSLRRTASGQFKIENAYTPEQLSELADRLEDIIIPTDRMFAEYPEIHLNDKQKRSIVNGVHMTWRGGIEGQSYRLYDEDGVFLCISKCIDGRLCLEKSFWN